MNFNNYPNINAYIQSKGGFKEKLINKGVYKKAMASWDQLSDEELDNLEHEVKTGSAIFDALVTPTAIIICTMWTARVIPARDILWIFSRINKQKLNFVTISRIHNLLMLDRNGEWYSLGYKTTGMFSKDTPADDALDQIQAIIEETAPGAIIGYDEDASQWCESHVDWLVEKVDGRAAYTA